MAIFPVLNLIVLQKVNPHYAEAGGKADALFKHLTQRARDQYTTTAQVEYERIRWMTLFGVLGAAGLAAFLTIMLIRSIVRPLALVVDTLNNVSQGKYGNVIDVGRDDELGKAQQGLQAMQTRRRFGVMKTKC